MTDLTADLPQACDLVSRLQLSAIGADDPANYLPRGISAKDCVDAADLIRDLALAVQDFQRLAKDRIQDGDQMGARMWRIALEDIGNDPDARALAARGLGAA